MFSIKVGLGFAMGLIVASFFEWLIHVAMHRRYFLGRIHTQHHKDGSADGWIWEALYYLAGAIPAGALVIGISVWLELIAWGVGIAAGGVVYALFAGFAHQLQHERPELVFWMNPPVHTVHHHYQMWRRNFGIGVDVWDKLLGTYQTVGWIPKDGASRRVGTLGEYLRIRWI